MTKTATLISTIVVLLATATTAQAAQTVNRPITPAMERYFVAQMYATGRAHGPRVRHHMCNAYAARRQVFCTFIVSTGDNWVVKLTRPKPCILKARLTVNTKFVTTTTTRWRGACR